MKLFFKLTFLLFSALVIIFSSCKKKTDAPSPALPPTASASLRWEGNNLDLPVPIVDTASGFYKQYTTKYASLESFRVIFYNGKPTTNTTYNMATQSNLIGIQYADPYDNAWQGSAGTVSVNVNQGYVTTSFTNLTFHNSVTGDILNVKGSITTN
jgi:hypothetical protein